MRQAYDLGISKMLFRTCCMASDGGPLGVVSVRPTGHHSSGARRSAANPAESVSQPAGRRLRVPGILGGWRSLKYSEHRDPTKLPVRV
ncbi:MAG: hypothetical protein E6Q55_04635 [Mycolicibacterium mageritense]|nr:MAG: hypothetical protein E6Q55_04635 [Mycolicibacterium mageritense]